MTGLLVAGAALLAGLTALVVGARRARSRAAVEGRLGAADRAADPAALPPPDDRPFVRPVPWVPWAVGAVVSLVLLLVFRWPTAYATLPGLLVGLLGGELDRLRVTRLRAKIETQLGDAIDIMVGALQAGAGVSAALDAAVREARWPLRPELADVAGRIRLGDDPQAVLRGLTRRVPLENFALFASALSVHWEVGGSLAGTLATVGKAVRDRAELSRRVNALTAQARASVAAVLAATYFIAAVIWRNNPDRMAGFLGSSIGAWLVGFAVALQAVGVVWSAALSRIRF